MKTCPIATRPIKMLHITSEKPDLLGYCNDYSAKFEYVSLEGRSKDKTKRTADYPRLSYTGPLPLKMAKAVDLKALAQFC